MKLFPVVLAFFLAASCVFASTSMDDFAAWAAQHNKHYSTPQEFRERFLIWKSNVEYIAQQNRNTSKSYALKLNEFADLTKEEFRGSYMGFGPTGAGPGAVQEEIVDVRGLPLDHEQGNPGTRRVASIYPEIDWRDRGAVTPVKHQGACGACWAFAATGALEGAYKIKTGQLVDFSEQQLLDCANSTGSQGCLGGFTRRAFAWWQQPGQTPCRDTTYPYRARQGTTCGSCSPVTDAKPRDIRIVPFGNETELERILQYGPVAVAVDASSPSFQFYSAGVYSGPCKREVNHAIVLVARKDDYWIFRNSWGGAWGEGGYIRMAKGDNLCGIASLASQPVL